MFLPPPLPNDDNGRNYNDNLRSECACSIHWNYKSTQTSTRGRDDRSLQESQLEALLWVAKGEELGEEENLVGVRRGLYPSQRAVK